MKYFNIIFFLIAVFFLSTKSFSNENWDFVKQDDWCYIKSSPVKTIIPDGKSRGVYGLIVYRINKNPELIVQITPGFNYKSENSVIVKIDDGEHSFYTDIDVAFAKNDSKVIFAMKKGLKFETLGISSMGTEVIDTYSLKGFTAAINKLAKDC